MNVISKSKTKSLIDRVQRRRSNVLPNFVTGHSFCEDEVEAIFTRTTKSALRSDWCQIGRDFDKAVRRLEKELKND